MHRFRQRFALFMALLLMLRAVIPVGYMPDMAALQKGELKLQICSGMGVKTITLPQDDAPQPKHDGKEKLAHCPFGAAPSLAVLPEAAVIAALVWQASLATTPILAVPEKRDGNPAARPRAPPTFS
jgi:hypothetical protein